MKNLRKIFRKLNIVRLSYDFITRNGGLISQSYTWYKFTLFILLILCIHLSRIWFHVSFSGSDVDGVYLDLPYKSYTNAKSSLTKEDFDRFENCQKYKNCIDDASFNILERGQYVGFCIPSREYTEIAVKVGLFDSNDCPYGGTPLSKHISAIPGDHIKITDKGILVNDKLIPNSEIRNKSISTWKIGQELIIPNGYYFISGSNLNSFDSRYFGLVFSGFIKTKSYLIFRFR